MSVRRNETASGRSRRVDDALSRLVDSILPPLSLSNLDEEYSAGEEDALAAADERRHRDRLARAWSIIENPTSGIDSTGDDYLAASSPSAENINNASDLIKRKLLRENASPDKAARFSNLYSRLLTQPLLSQKWAILYLLYRLSDSSDEQHGGDGNIASADGGERRSRSPLMEEGNLENILLRGSRNNRLTSRLHDDDDEGPAISSSVSQRGGRDERSSATAKKVAPELQKRRTIAADRRESVPSRARTENTAAESATVVNQPGPSRDTNGATNAVTNAPSESMLLRDLPYILQGLSSTNAEFTSASILKLPSSLPIPMISLLHTLAEPCLLYKNLSAFAEETEGGLVSQALRAAVGMELRSYLSLVATLEGEIRRAMTAASDEKDPKASMKGAVTLKRCVVWTRDATMALRLMSLVVEEARDKRGGQLISLVHSFSSSHGDPFVVAFAEKLLSHVTRPFYDMLRQWIYDGELSDPYKEFLVVEPEFRPAADPRRTATSVWEDKYKLDDEMVPTIITQEFAKKVFLIGKSLNFIRYGCGDSAWVEAYSKEASKELRYGDTASLETSIDEAYKTTMARLIYLMDSKFKLFEHLKAFKKYLLLGQGDFIALLMESLATNLDRPANSQYRHTLTAQLEHAIRASNAQFDSPDVLRRLDARMLELSHGEIGWDCFTLEYKIDAPVDVVITPWGSTQYLKVFNFLWRVKRVEFALGSTWRRCMTGARGVLANVEDKVGPDWKRARCAMAEMIHFVCQLQYYILFEVIEASWDELQAVVSKPGCTLDDLIEAHTNYLNSITHKGLLGSTSSSRHPTSSSSSIKQPEESFLSQLHQLLKTMLSYKDAVDGLYSFSVAEFTRRQELNAKIETRTAQGRWGVTERDFMPPASKRGAGAHGKSASSSFTTTPALAVPPGLENLANEEGGTDSPFTGSGGFSTDDHMLPSLQTRLRELSADFRARLNILLGDLAYQPDVDMRFLGVVMNFNDVYEPVRRRRTAGGTSTAAGGGSSSSRTQDRTKRRAGGTATTTTTAEEAASSSAAGTVEKDREKEKERPKSRVLVRDLETEAGSGSGTGSGV